MTDDGSAPDRLEAAVVRAADDGHRLVLFVNGASPQSSEAVANLRALCDEHLGGRWELTVVDVHQQPDLAIGQAVIALPALIREEPLSVRMVVGDLSDPQRVLRGLGLHPGDTTGHSARPGAQ